MKWSCYLLVFCLLIGSYLAENEKPHIIVIIADDMGFNDVGFHGSNQIPTPNIDALAYNGVILNSHYTQALCTPSRAAFLTGKYPIHLGMQHLVILEPEPWGLPLNETIIPQHLKKNGYSTHAVGKWHLGFFEKEYTPTFRGFDTHYGYWQGLQDYYSHMTHATYTPEMGYDMRRNMDVDHSAKGKYSTTLFTQEAVRLIREHDAEKPMFLYMAHLAPHTGNDNDPLQAPDEEIAKFAYIEDPERRVYAAMVSMLDQSVGSVIAALREKRMLENSIILFISDNGAQPEGIHANHGSNYPFKGAKNSAWEGAQRNLAAIWSPRIKKNKRVSNHFMHLTDWLPTFYSAAGLNKSEISHIDGMDMWEAISEGAESPRTELIYNIDDITQYGGLRRGEWKYVYGSTSKGKADRWFEDPGKHTVHPYEKNAVLNSKAGTALAGIITYQQIKEKNSKNTANNFSTELLDETTIDKLRRDATIKCKPMDDVADQLETTKCDLLKSPCLFNIKDDPCERVNLAYARPNIVANMEQAIVQYRKTALPPRNLPRDPHADPAKWGGVWTNWRDCEKVVWRKVPLETLSPLALTMISLAAVTVVVIVICLLFLSYYRGKTKERRRSTTSINGHTVDRPLDDDNHMFDEEKASLQQV